MGFGACDVGPYGFFWGWGSLYINRRITMGKNLHAVQLLLHQDLFCVQNPNGMETTSYLELPHDFTEWMFLFCSNVSLQHATRSQITQKIICHVALGGCT